MIKKKILPLMQSITFWLLGHREEWENEEWIWRNKWELSYTAGFTNQSSEIFQIRHL